MTLVHLVGRASGLEACLRYVGPDDTVLLFADGVYAATDARKTQATVLALEDDATARGVRIESPVVAVGYDRFVDLVVSHDASVTWT